MESPSQIWGFLIAVLGQSANTMRFSSIYLLHEKVGGFGQMCYRSNSWFSFWFPFKPTQPRTTCTSSPSPGTRKDSNLPHGRGLSLRLHRLRCCSKAPFWYRVYIPRFQNHILLFGFEPSRMRPSRCCRTPRASSRRIESANPGFLRLKCERHQWHMQNCVDGQNANEDTSCRWRMGILQCL